uniref:Myb-like domain-containing protein n=1 Tax=Oryza nivara TaxID=4536 RepID=A0A0E0HPZ3_ORYNI
MLLSHCFAVVFALSALLAGLALAIDEGFGMEWTAAELAEARSVIARVSDAYNSGVGSSSSACDTKHDRIMRELQARFPSRTMVQVIDLYVNLTVETAAQLQDAGSAGDAAAVVHPTFAGGMPVVNNNDGMVLGGAAMEEGAVAVNGGDGEVVNPDNADDDVLWTDYEHRLFLTGMRVYGRGDWRNIARLFLTGMRVYGRGDWRNISRYFVRSKTPEQISMYADNYFHMMEIAAAMEADGGDDDDGHHEINNNNNNLGGGQLHAVVGAVGHGPGAGHIAPATPSNNNAAAAAVNNNVDTPFWVPLLYNPEIEQRMMEMQAQSQKAWDDQQMKMAEAATPKEEGAADK